MVTLLLLVCRLAIVYTNTTASVKRILLKFLDQLVYSTANASYCLLLLLLLLDTVYWYGFSPAAGLGSSLSRDCHYENVAHINREWYSGVGSRSMHPQLSLDFSSVFICSINSKHNITLTLHLLVNK